MLLKEINLFEKPLSKDGLNLEAKVKVSIDFKKDDLGMSKTVISVGVAKKF